MAKAAEKAVILNRWQTWLTGLGALLLLGTLFLTVRSTGAAVKAGDAAADQARIMRRADRPYLMPRNLELRGFPDPRGPTAEAGGLQIWFQIENLGKGIAFFDSRGIAHEVCRTGEEGRKDLKISADFGRLPIRSDSTWIPGAAFYIFELSQDEVYRAVSDLGTLFVYGMLRYSDIYGVFRKTGFAFSYCINTWNHKESALVMHPNRALWYDIEEAPEARKRRWYQKKRIG